MMNQDMQQQNEDLPQQQTHSAEAQEEKTPAPERRKKYLRRLGQVLCILLVACAVLCCLVIYQMSRHIPYCDRASTCSAAEADANNILAELADYFAIPVHTTLGPTPILIGPQACIRNGIPFSALRGENTAKITGDIDNLTVSVLDASGKCPKSYQEDFPEWKNGVFSSPLTV